MKSFFFLKILFFCVWVFCLHFGCAPYACSAYGSQRRALDPRELELEMAVRCWESKLGAFQEQPMLLTAEPSLQLHAQTI